MKTLIFIFLVLVTSHATKLSDDYVGDVLIIKSSQKNHEEEHLSIRLANKSNIFYSLCRL
jgi:hypothetical protein